MKHENTSFLSLLNIAPNWSQYCTEKHEEPAVRSRGNFRVTDYLLASASANQTICPSPRRQRQQASELKRKTCSWNRISCFQLSGEAPLTDNAQISVFLLQQSEGVMEWAAPLNDWSKCAAGGPAELCPPLNPCHFSAVIALSRHLVALI